MINSFVLHAQSKRRQLGKTEDDEIPLQDPFRISMHFHTNVEEALINRLKEFRRDSSKPRSKSISPPHLYLQKPKENHPVFTQHLTSSKMRLMCDCLYLPVQEQVQFFFILHLQYNFLTLLLLCYFL